MTREEMQRLADAHDVVWDGWWPPLVEVPADLLRRPLGGSYPSVLATTAHMVAAEIFWQDRLEDRVLAADPPEQPIEALRSLWDAVKARRRAYLRVADPGARVFFVAASGATVSVAAWECLVHVVSHAHFHRGQLVTQFRALGLLPPSRHLVGAFFDEY